MKFNKFNILNTFKIKILNCFSNKLYYIVTLFKLFYNLIFLKLLNSELY